MYDRMTKNLGQFQYVQRENKFLSNKKRVGKSFNAEVRNKDYRNPDFLLHAVRYQDIDQIGYCFIKDVFDPHGYDKSDYYDEIEADMKREMERKVQDQHASSNHCLVLFCGLLGFAGVSTMAASGLHSIPSAADAVVWDSRQNKKSKWDKVDGDRRNTLPSGGQDSISTLGHMLHFYSLLMLVLDILLSHILPSFDEDME
ncbi:hypothetical protein L1049_007245 [Liquidambar formosana]|uniref:Uncharacterized protein n=1 Tax=Liquidambar formosana TaxID=63359 RepID=A0AAP0RIF7_LIQFO